MNCSTPPNFLGTHEFIRCFLHTLLIFELPIHSFGAYCIILKTPKRMQHVKWTMFNVHFWTAFLDVSNTALICPYMLFPAIAGMDMGLLTVLGVEMVYQVYFNFSLSWTVGSSITALLECRYNLFMGGPSWARWRIAYYIFNYTFSVTFMLPQMLFMLPDQASAIETFRQYLPCSWDTIPKSVFGLKLSTDFNYIMLILAFFAAHLTASCLFFAFSVERHLRKIKNTSRQTAKLQSKLQFAVITQLLIPSASLIAPVFFAVISVKTGYHNTILNNLTVIVMCFHGMISTTAMLLLHQPYRDALSELITIRKKVEAHSTLVSQQIGSVVL